MLLRKFWATTVLAPLIVLVVGISAHAGWGISVGVASGPGYPGPYRSGPVFVGGGIYRPVYAPSPVIVMPRPVYVAPRPVYVITPPAPPPVYVQPAPSYYPGPTSAEPPVYSPPASSEPPAFTAPMPSPIEQAPQPQRLTPIPQPSVYYPNR